MTVHQLLPAFMSGDAIGNQTAAIRQILRQRGMRDSEVFAQHRDERRPDPGLDYRRLRLRRSDWLIYHHSIGSPVAQVALDHLDRVIFYYHNVTPARYLRGYNDRMADLLREGREILPRFRQTAAVWADSAFNLGELDSIGFRAGAVIPLLVDAPALIGSARSEAGRRVIERYALPGNQPVNWLFVGRLAPNKRQDALIRAFHYYHALINSNSRLLLVGSDLSAPGYALELESLAAALGLRERVVFAGAPAMAEGFGSYYGAASVFVCASEHEGFCVPIVEAMAFGLPVVAFNTTGVPCAVGDAGLLIESNAPAELAEAVDLLLGDEALRLALGRRQPARISAHSAQALALALDEQLARLR